MRLLFTGFQRFQAFSLPVSAGAFLRIATGVVLIGSLTACSPALNWREVRTDGAMLRLLLPCKPDRAEKTVPLGGQSTAMRLLGCDADGATFAVAVADLPAAASAAATATLLAQWQSLALANMGAPATPASAKPLKIQGQQQLPPGLPPPLRIRAIGKRADGTPVASEMVFFAQGNQLFQAVVYAPVVTAEMGDTFFDSLVFEQ